MPEQQIVAFRAGKEIADALDKAAKMHGTNRSLLIKSWLTDRLQAEGFIFGSESDDDDQAGHKNVDRSRPGQAGRRRSA